MATVRTGHAPATVVYMLCSCNRCRQGVHVDMGKVLDMDPWPGMCQAWQWQGRSPAGPPSL
jgi:hypothetical protein